MYLLDLLLNYIVSFIDHPRIYENRLEKSRSVRRYHFQTLEKIRRDRRRGGLNSLILFSYREIKAALVATPT